MKKQKKRQQKTLTLNIILRWVVIVIGAGMALFALQSVALWLPWRWTYEFAANGSAWPFVQLGLTVGVGLAGGALWWLGSRRLGIVYIALSALCLIPVTQTMISLDTFARSQGIPLSVTQQFDVSRNQYAADEASVRYGRVAQTDLVLSSYLTSEMTAKNPVIVYVHGGGWSGGSRTENSDFFRWLNSRGYHVLSIDYRIAKDNYASWQDAPRDVVCALAWLNSAAAERYGIDRSAVTLMGDSAGGQLALRAAYGVANGDLTSSCGGQPLVPASVVGIVPAIDFVELYDDPRLGPTSRENVVRYLGGSPATASDAYSESSIITHVKAGLPRTLIINAERDTLVSPRSGEALAAKLREAGVDAEQYTLPYTVHSYWINPGGYQNQIGRQIIKQFLAH